MRVVFTGGSGKAGRHVVPYLRDKGHEVLNLDLVPLDCPGVNTLITDVTDLGQVFNALTMHFGFEGYDTGKGPAKVDAVVHFAAVPRVLIVPDNEVFRINVMSTYNVIEAAVKLGIRKVVIASSETTYGVCFAEGERDFASLPLEEDDDVDPMDSYALSKVVNEKNARAFALRTGADIYALRIGNVIEPHEYDRFPGFVANPASRKRNAWSYIDARDLGQIVDLCLRQEWAGLSGVQCRQRHDHGQRADRRILEALGAEHAAQAGDGGLRVAVLQPQDPRRAAVSRKSTTGGIMFEQRRGNLFDTPPHPASASLGHPLPAGRGGGRAKRRPGEGAYQ